MFIMRIATLVASGRDPKVLKRNVRAPQPQPKIIIPLWVTGEVTMSVAIKKAPRIKPPLKMLAITSPWKSPSPRGIPPKIKVKMAKDPIKATGICQVITFEKIRYNPPSKSKSFETSPIQPGIFQ